jgi:hypothetical protein
MPTYKSPALTLCLGLWLAGCVNEADMCESGFRSMVDRDDLRAALVDDLAARGVPVRSSASGEVCYAPQYRELVVSRIIALDLALRPANRMSIPDPELALLAKERIAQAGIHYETINESGVSVLVFDNDADALKAVRLVSELSRSHYESQSKY